MNEDKTHYYKPSVTKGEYVSEKELIENLVYPDTMYKKQIQELKQQLQAYKDKEDKLREYCENYIEKEDSFYGTVYAVKSEFHEVLQILNEGGKK